MMKKLKFAVAVSISLFAGASLFATDIFITPTGGGDLSGSSWSNAINGGENNLIGLKIRDVITNAVANNATEVNVYLAGGSYPTTNQVTLSSISIPVKISGGYLGVEDGSFERSETATTISRASGYIRLLYSSSLSSLTLEGITFTGGYLFISDKGSAQGGALYLASTSTTISNCVFSNNRAADGGSYAYYRGGAVYSTGGNLTINNSSFNNNFASGGFNAQYGGAICTLRTHVLIDGCTFEKNYVSASQEGGFGGAVCINGYTAKIKNTTLSGNYSQVTSKNGHNAGGALAIRSVTRFEMSDCKLLNNYVRALSGTVQYISGCYFDDFNAADGVATSVVERCVFDSSSASTASYTKSDILLNCGRLFMTNCLISNAKGAHSDMDYGIRTQRITLSKYLKDFVSEKYGLVVTPSSIELVNCTVADGNFNGAGAIGSGAELALENCIVWGNAQMGIVNAASVRYTCSQEEQEGEGNFVADPHWTGTPYYHLITKMKNGYIDDGYFGGAFDNEKAEASSPCIDAGAPNSLNHIFEPHARGRRINLGAYGGTPWASKTYYQVGSILYLK